jgi:hypothetical protein
VHLKGYLWSPKTHDGILYPFRILHSCKETYEEWCTVGLEVVESTWDHAGWHKRWRTHDLRGIAPSKATNMGFPKVAAIRRGRWAKKSSAFEKHYLRIANFEESSPYNATKSFESVIRLKETII